MNALYLSTNGDSITQLPTPLEIQSYGCGVIEMTGKVYHTGKEPIYLCSDICEESFVGQNKMPILLRIKRGASGIVNSNIHNIIWLHVMRPTISSIRLYISNSKGEIISLGEEELNCTLLFIPKQK